MKTLRKGDRVRGGKGVHGTVVRWNAYLQCFVVRWDNANHGWESYERRNVLRALPTPKARKQRRKQGVGR